jgi:hypothetical protein
VAQAHKAAQGPGQVEQLGQQREAQAQRRQQAQAQDPITERREGGEGGVRERGRGLFSMDPLLLSLLFLSFYTQIPSLPPFSLV